MPQGDLLPPTPQSELRTPNSNREGERFMPKGDFPSGILHSALRIQTVGSILFLYAVFAFFAVMPV